MDCSTRTTNGRLLQLPEILRWIERDDELLDVTQDVTNRFPGEDMFVQLLASCRCLGLSGSGMFATEPHIHSLLA